jgi:hypothetical protein
MKVKKYFPVAVILIGILLGACAAPAAPSASPGSDGVDKALFSEVVFSGVIEGMDGDLWTINGQTVKVDSSVLRDGPFVVGDTVKVEALVAADGSVTAQRVESPSAADLSEIGTSTPAVASAQLPLVFDDSGTQALGTVESITDTSITIGGQTFAFAPGVEIKGTIAAGAVVKLHFLVSADGSLSVREVEIADPSQVNSDNSNDNSNGSAGIGNSNDDNGNDDNSNDDNGNDDDSNDNNGGNSNDDDDDDDNSNDSNDNG